MPQWILKIQTVSLKFRLEQSSLPWRFCLFITVREKNVPFRVKISNIITSHKSKSCRDILKGYIPLNKSENGGNIGGDRVCMVKKEVYKQEERQRLGRGWSNILISIHHKIKTIHARRVSNGSMYLFTYLNRFPFLQPSQFRVTVINYSYPHRLMIWNGLLWKGMEQLNSVPI